MFGYPADNWNEKINPLSLRRDFVDSLQTCMSDGTLTITNFKIPTSLQKSEKEIIKGLNTDLNLFIL
jgi:hypothetical protein